ncbi:MAG: Two component transcriptional regulator, winged helix family [Candidatus Uhrbacteria bacterium GW2011_GWE2_40_58]|nr:MAG: Two component transcriptional regulator, winged helix family [Candidatus Uhrbacteria bacterium GW2011_GWF2_40_263]KKR67895.1 MAG: Two component transcriptional regulator, winged helix family [Candidatus Uhrbacteria bacterium GW2011_GWE2_40_58]OGL92495.1 MAG: hypothetical protein A2239_01635 [Candidatus Uhrbacteria bacterium RIFOXYA2_FULL_40_9]OGL96864.1 MAG: hypothetical protein A2332_01970 [Candidatus Uhrbacteria bacterium RIFOXYB2_FULL_41_18]HBK34540.1 response regulator [Candidatus U
MKERKTILLVEDDIFLVAAYKDGLEREGFIIQVATDGEEAMAQLAKEIPDLILLDLIMPVKDGFEVLEEMHQDADLKKIPVIILTNLGQEEDIKKGKELGAIDYLVKANFTLAEVVKIIENHLK